MAKDPYKYFRIEAQELLEGLTQGFLDLDKGPDLELVQRLFRLAHTFKGASRVVRRGDIADLAHELEDVLTPHRQSGGPVESEAIDRGLTLLGRIREFVETLGEAPNPKAVPEGREPAVARREGVVVSVRDLDRLLQIAVEAHSGASSTTRRLGEMDSLLAAAKRSIGQVADGVNRGLRDRLFAVIGEIDGLHRAMEEKNDSLVNVLGELRDSATSMRLVPVRSLTTDLEQIARTAARTLSREIRFETAIGATHLDARIHAGVREALVHLVQNAIAHGIEPAEERKRRGKSPEGRLVLGFERKGPRLIATCTDDGRGFDFDRIKEALVRRGDLSVEQAERTGEAELGELILNDSISTAERISGVAGRGVGLGAAKAATTALRGELSLSTKKGKGTTFTLDVPFTLSALDALSVSSGGLGAYIPLDSVKRALKIRSADIRREEGRERLLVDDVLVPFVPMERFLGRPLRPQGETAVQAAVVVQCEQSVVALGVERIGAAQSIVTQNVPPHAAARETVQAVALDESGLPVLVLSPGALVANTDALSGPHVVAVEEATSSPILVIDDSLTTRMLEQSILESAGYEVDLAVSGVEALKKAKARRYGAFIVDVEMPEMNGFEFLEHVRSDPELEDVPSILVTSLDSPEHKRRGMQAGARAYMVKSDFDQEVLLQCIRRFV